MCLINKKKLFTTNIFFNVKMRRKTLFPCLKLLIVTDAYNLFIIFVDETLFKFVEMLFDVCFVSTLNSCRQYGIKIVKHYLKFIFL